MENTSYSNSLATKWPNDKSKYNENYIRLYKVREIAFQPPSARGKNPFRMSITYALTTKYPHTHTHMQMLNSFFICLKFHL